MKLRLKLMIILSLLTISIGFVSPASASTVKVAALVDDAFYADIDTEGDNFDIQYDVSIYIFDFKWYHQIVGYEFNLYIGLEYPSGLEYWWKAVFLAYNSYISFSIVFEDAAYESGIYTAHLFSQSANNQKTLVYDQFEFDPPGGNIGGPPGIVFFL